MSYQHLEPISRQMTILIGLTVVGFMAFGLVLSFYRNVIFEQTLSSVAAKNSILKEEIADGKRNLEYYRSAQYKDKYAKENLGLVNPGEEVLVLTPLGDLQEERDFLSSADEQQEAAYAELLKQMPVLEHWKMYLFHPEQVEELRRSYGREG